MRPSGAALSALRASPPQGEKGCEIPAFAGMTAAPRKPPPQPSPDFGGGGRIFGRGPLPFGHLPLRGRTGCEIPAFAGMTEALFPTPRRVSPLPSPPPTSGEGAGGRPDPPAEGEGAGCALRARPSLPFRYLPLRGRTPSPRRVRLPRLRGRGPDSCLRRNDGFRSPQPSPVFGGGGRSGVSRGGRTRRQSPRGCAPVGGRSWGLRPRPRHGGRRDRRRRRRRTASRCRT